LKSLSKKWRRKPETSLAATLAREERTHGIVATEEAQQDKRSIRPPDLGGAKIKIRMLKLYLQV